MCESENVHSDEWKIVFAVILNVLSLYLSLSPSISSVRYSHYWMQHMEIQSAKKENGIAFQLYKNRRIRQK